MAQRKRIHLGTLVAFSLLAGPAACADDDLGGAEETADSDATADGDATSEASSESGDGEAEATGDGDGDGVPSEYEFESRFDDGESSVSYSGQTFRQVLVKSLVAEIEAINTEITVDGEIFEAGDVAGRLNFYYQFDSATAGAVAHGITTTPETLQTSFDDISSDKDLQGKVAGNDATGQHADWSTDLVGWDGSSPDELIMAWITQLDTMAVDYSTGTIPTDPGGAQVAVFYVAADGRDYKQLLEKFMLGAINFSQGADDYLDNDTEGKGLQSDNTEADEDNPYTALEHAWDEGFGYWGGARNYLDYTDDELAGSDGRPEFSSGYNDADGDDKIDLKTEYNFSASVNAAKRDRGSSESAPTDFTADAMNAFLAGRHILASSSGALSDDEMAALVAERDKALTAWEQSLAATAVHYFNDSLQDLNADEYNFTDNAKHWSELKGFLLMLQFSPSSPLGTESGEADYQMIHTLVGTAPVLPGGDTAAYMADLVTARDMLGEAYGFSAQNLGDNVGEGGW